MENDGRLSPVLILRIADPFSPACSLPIIFTPQNTTYSLIYRHPNVLALHTWFNDKKRIVLALEYAQKGELFKHLQREGRFSDAKSSRVRTIAVASCAQKS